MEKSDAEGLELLERGQGVLDRPALAAVWLERLDSPGRRWVADGMLMGHPSTTRWPQPEASENRGVGTGPWHFDFCDGKIGRLLQDLAPRSGDRTAAARKECIRDSG